MTPVGWKRCHADNSQKRLKSGKRDFKSKTVTRDGSTERYSNYRYICMEHYSISIHKTAWTALKGEVEAIH